MTRMLKMFQVDKYLYNLAEILRVETLNKGVTDFTGQKVVESLE